MRMSQIFRTIGLLLLLVVAQHGAVVHELSHVVGARSGELECETAKSADATCALCPVFAQVVSPGLSHSIQAPRLVEIALERISEPRNLAIGAAVPQARSRGPPVTS
jgi:hypothetical protein